MRLRIWQGSITADMADLMWMAGYVGDYPAVQETKVFTDKARNQNGTGYIYV